jgi:S1-C subfamily serine protease
VTTRAALASVAIVLVAGLAGGALALTLRGDAGGGERTVVTTVVRGDGGSSFDPVALYASARHGIVTIEASFGDGHLEVGSGFVVDAKGGLIVTASHVVAQTRSGSASATLPTAVFVVLDDSTRVDATMVGYDLFEDTALVKVDPKDLGLHALPLGRARALRVGDLVAAIGSPFENRASLSTGVVSQLDRQIEAPGVCGFRTTGVIQTDAAVNPGNSGGPLLDAGGRVVGMVTAIADNPGARGGVAYAVPIEAVGRSYAALAAGHRFPYASLGVAATTVTPILADKLDISVQHGALVRELIQGGAAARAGLHAGSHEVQVAGQTYPRDGDVIVAVGSTPVAGYRDLDRAIAAHRAGERVDLHVVRSDGKHVVAVRLLPRPASFANCNTG